MEEIRFSAKHNIDGKLYYGSNSDIRVFDVNNAQFLSLSNFWFLVEVGELDANTVRQHADIGEDAKTMPNDEPLLK